MVTKIRTGLWIDLSLITRLRFNETSEEDDCYEVYTRDEGYTFYDEEDGKLIENALEKYLTPKANAQTSTHNQSIYPGGTVFL